MKRLAFEYSYTVYNSKLRLSVTGSDNMKYIWKIQLNRCRYTECTGKSMTTFIIEDNQEMIEMISAPCVVG